MVHDVDDVAVWCPDERPVHTHGSVFIGFPDLVAEFLSLFISRFDIVGVDGNNRVFGGGCVARHELEGAR
jgi:hypothetical protein